MLGQDGLETLIQLVAKWELYSNCNKRERLLHRREIDRINEYHKIDLKLSKEVHLRSLYYDMREHENQLEFDIINAYKANERDMYDQKNRQTQTMIVANSIMLSALISILIQAIIPSETAEYAKIIFSASGSISLGLLAISIIFYVQVIFKCTRFMDDRGKYHAGQWKSVKERIKMDGTESIIQKTDGNNKEMEDTYSIELDKKIEKILDASNNRNDEDKKKFLFLNKDRLNLVQESIIKHYVYIEVCDDVESLDSKSLSSKSLSSEKLKSFSKISGTFEDFWNNNCKLYDMLGTRCFYAGTMMLLTNLMTYNYEYFYHDYNSKSGAIISIFIISFSLIIALVVLMIIKVKKKYKNQEKIISDLEM